MKESIQELFKGTEVHWLKLLGSLLLIFTAVYLPAVAMDTASSVAAVSAALSAVGGALLADAFATPRRFLKIIAPRLNSINRLLATITSQVSAIIVEEKRKSEDNHPINRLSEMVPGLRAVIADINDLAGEKFDPNVLNETIDSIGELITQLESGKIDPDSDSLANFLKTIQGNLKKEAPAETVSEALCPYEGCDGRAQVELGAFPSTSKVVKCPTCKNKYHAQRGPNDTVETKEWGASSKTA